MSDIIIVNNKEDFKAEAELGNVVVWDGKDKLFELLEDLQLSSSVKYRLKACYEIQYKNGITFSGTGAQFEANKLSEVLKRKLNFNKNDRIVVKSNDVAEVLETIQQLIYLGLVLDVYTEEEVLKKSIIDKFYKSAKDIKNAVLNFQTKLKDYETNTEAVLNRKTNLEKIIEDILEKIDKSFEKTIKVAVFATKKTGKSMIVNDLLGEEYAPTSLELATPNVIEYIPHDGKEIIFEYKDSIQTFNSPKEIKEYIGKLFKEVNTEGKKLPVMKVKYPRKKGINYEIYDTPGPDLAGSEHHEFIDEYIEKSDVIIFAIDYTKYAQDSEVKLLEKIRSFFEQKEKNYSLICVLNKIDDMLKDLNNEKNKIRATDFIYNKMKILGFRNFIVLPLSALTYFYTEKVLDIYRKYKEKDINKESFYKELSDFVQNLKNVSDEEEVTYVLNVFEILQKIKYLYKIENPTYYDLINWTGFPYLLEYINYVVENKAMLEKSWSILVHIGNRITQIENDIAAKEFLNKQINELKTYLNDFLKEAQEEYAQEEMEQAFENMKSKFRELFIKEVPDRIYREIHTSIKDSFYKCKTELEYSLNEFIKKHNIPEWNVNLEKNQKDKIISSFEKEVDGNLIDKKIVEELISHIKEQSLRYIDDIVVDRINNGLKGLGKDLESKKGRIKEKIDKLNKNLEKNYNFSVELKLPTLELDVNYILTEIDKAAKSIQKNLTDLANLKLQSKDILKFEEYKEVYSYKKWFKTYKEEYISYRISGTLIKRQLNEALKKFEKKLDDILKGIKSELESSFNKVDLGSLDESIDITKEGYISGLNAIINPITNIVQELSLEKSITEEIYSFLCFVEEQFKDIDKYFYDIRKDVENTGDNNKN